MSDKGNWITYQQLEARLAASEAREAAMAKAIERTIWYYTEWDSETTLPSDWPKNDAGQPLSIRDMLRAALAQPHEPFEQTIRTVWLPYHAASKSWDDGPDAIALADDELTKLVDGWEWVECRVVVAQPHELRGNEAAMSPHEIRDLLRGNAVTP